MNIILPLPIIFIAWVKQIAKYIPAEAFILFTAAIISIISTAFFYAKDYIIAYGDAESHLNISKRVVDSVTPGFAQLGGIWLPLPHLLMMPFTYFDSLWRTGLAGSIVSGIAFGIIAVILYKLIVVITNNKLAGIVAFLVFALNPNILYMQSTPMTELPLIAFFMLSSYFFILFIKNHYQPSKATATEAEQQASLLYLLAAAFFGFLASLTRYDGWFLVLFEAVVLVALYAPKRSNWQTLKGHIVLFSTLAFFGIVLWFLWDFLILGDPLYFTNSEFSAKSQQMAWLRRGELPAYHQPILSFLYYLVTAMSNVGILAFFTALIGLYYFIKNKSIERLLMVAILLVPFLFYVVTLFMGQSVIFTPHITPVSFEWRLFNVRYGLMMVPAAAFLIAYLFTKVSFAQRVVIVFVLILQSVLYLSNYSSVVTLTDGTTGLSRAKKVDAQAWIRKNYDTGLVLMDDYARSLSVIRTTIPMKNVIYIGNKPYWEESLKEPEKYATWIIVQKDDMVWRSLLDNPDQQARLYAHFEKAYTSPEISIFKRSQATASR